jgi:hypothetical protein
MSKKLRLLLLVLEAMLLASCWPFESYPPAADHDDDHHNMPGRHAASERWDVSVSSGSKLLSADAASWLESRRSVRCSLRWLVAAGRSRFSHLLKPRLKWNPAGTALSLLFGDSQSGLTMTGEDAEHIAGLAARNG